MRPTLAGSPAFLLGVNYWSRGGGPRMWEEARFDAALVRRELAQMRAIGLNTCRSFAFIPTFMPSPPRVEAGALERLRRFLDLCQAERMATIPSFLVGHMSGENYDFPGQRGRCLYTDPELLDWQRALVRAVSAPHPAVVAYLASNEMPRWGGGAAPETIAAWGRSLRGALACDRPFGLGDGVMNLDGGQDGFDVLALRGVIDFIGPHTYYADADPLRQALNAEFCLRSVTHAGLPVLLEEFGCASTQVSEANQALYYRGALHACLGAGAAGALGWCFSDFDLEREAPYAHHAFELGFGITRADGSEKPVCDELRAFSRLVTAELDWPTLRPPRPEAAILLPSYFNTSYPFSWEDRGRMRRDLLQAYVLCAAAGIEAELVPETADLAGYKLVLAPSTQKLLAPTWRALLHHARAGNTVYWSYFNGDYPFHQGAWCHLLEELTGCRHGLRYACVDLPDEDWTLRCDDGFEVRTSTAGVEPFPRAYLPLEPLDAEVLGRDDHGRPALVRARRGRGQVLFLNHPLEHYLARQHGATPGSGAHRLYQSLLGPPVRSDAPWVQVRRAADARGELLWLINHAWDEQAVGVDTPGGQAIHGAEAELAAGQVSVQLLPKQVIVYRLVSSTSSRACQTRSTRTSPGRT